MGNPPLIPTFTVRYSSCVSCADNYSVLSISPQTVLVDSRQIKLRKLLEKNGLEVIPITLRHMYTQGGGIHCATLDTVRDSKLEDYS